MAEEEKPEPESRAPSSEDQDYQEAVRSTADYDEYQKPQKEHRPIWRKLGIGVLAALLILAVLGGVYWLVKGHKSIQNPPPSSQTQQSSTPTTAKITKTTKHYDSTNLNLGFDYPADWTVTDSGNGQMTVRSPAVAVKDQNGQTVSAQITMTIRASDQALPEFDDGNGLAAQDSEKVAYSQPTQSQRANTYLTLVSYAGSSGGFDAVYITADNGYKKDQAVPKIDIQKVDPIISVTFTKCTNNSCTGQKTVLSISLDNWSDPGFADPIKTMLQSLAIT